MATFLPEQRERIRTELLDRARLDPKIAGAAVTGSAALGREDRWSDIDLAFAVAPGHSVSDVADGFAAFLYDRHGAVHHLDIAAGAWLYRVFFLAGTLQVDLAFVPQSEFRAMAPSFRLVFGEAGADGAFPAPTARGLAGMAWLHAIHARSCLERGKLWQAEYMISGTRNHALTLACLRLGLECDHGRGFDRLPAEVTAPLTATLAAGLDTERLRAAFAAAVRVLAGEVRLADPELGARIEPELAALINES